LLGLPEAITACLFDLDGVLTDTAAVHAAAWKAMFDEYLRARGGPGTEPFDINQDYRTYVDGKPRMDGVASFLDSRGIQLPHGSTEDPPDRETVCGLGNKKNALVLTKIRDQGVQAYPGSVRYLEAVASAGLRRAVVSSSANCKDVIVAAGIDRYLEVRVDGVVAAERHLKGKPAPDTFLEAGRELGVDRSAAAVFEDALSGVAAGRAGGFGCVVGVDRHGTDAEGLRTAGADLVVGDLGELLGEGG
jgi:beta-phosphoglucomutase family hydrolase